MADITMCTNTCCPNARHCYRVQAKPSQQWQPYQLFQYMVGKNGAECDRTWGYAIDL